MQAKTTKNQRLPEKACFHARGIWGTPFRVMTGSGLTYTVAPIRPDLKFTVAVNFVKTNDRITHVILYRKNKLRATIPISPVKLEHPKTGLVHDVDYYSAYEVWKQWEDLC